MSLRAIKIKIKTHKTHEHNYNRYIYIRNTMKRKSQVTEQNVVDRQNCFVEKPKCASVIDRVMMKLSR